MENILLVVDIGNTTISYGLYNKNRLIKTRKILTIDILFKKGILKKFTEFKKSNIKAIIICSVVPKATEKLKSALQKIYSIKPIILGRDLKVPMKNLYINPKQVGQDRLVGAYAGYKLYGYPLIIVDFGTAITFDVVSKNREYLGGIIVPGVEMALEALYEKTALLPKAELNKIPQSLIGKDTKNSILSGICFGFGSLCDGLIQKLKNKIGDCKVIATGGHARIINKYCKSIDKVDNKLILKGLEIIYNEFKNS